MKIFWGILIPFLGTTAGAACVFFMKKSLGDLVQRSLAGFAAGVMVAATIWSLLIPAIERSAALGRFSFFPAFAGFWLGVLFLLALDHLIPHLHVGSEQAEGPKSNLSRTAMMVLAVTLHNIPEGMAVGVMYAGFLSGSAQITAASAFALSLGIAIQNFPEGAIISLPLKAEGERNSRAFLGGVLFFHAMGVTGESSEPVARCLKDRYFCILPTSTVYCAGQKYTGKADEVRQVEDFLRNHGVTRLKLVAASSIGADLAVAFLTQTALPVEHVFFDGGMVAQIYVQKYPGETGGLILISTGGMDANTLKSLKRKYFFAPLMLWYMKHCNYEKLKPTLIKAGMSHIRNESAEEIAYAQDMFETIFRDFP